MLPKTERLTVRDIEALSSGTSVFSTLVSLRMVQSDKLKFSVTVSKKVAPTAVMRNRIRRRTYSLLDKIKGEVNKKAFIMLMPKKDFFDGSLDTLETELRNLFKKAHLI